MKQPWPTLLFLLAVALAFALGRWGGSDLSREIGAARDSLAVTRDSLRAALVAYDAFQKADTLPRQAEVQLARADSLSVRRSHRDSSPPSPPATVGDTLQWWKDRVDTLQVWLEETALEANLSRSSAQTYREAHRQAVEAASRLYVAAMVSDGRLSQTIAKLDELHDKARGCRLPFVGVRCPSVGPSVFVGVDGNPRVGVGITFPL